MSITELLNKIIQGNCLEVMRKQIADSYVDLTVTSPPYDNLRTYNGYSFDFEGIAQELYRVTKPGGVVVWIVGDATIKGSETGTSFRQALYFKKIGFNLHDTMIYVKSNPLPLKSNRYQPCFEYMFILSKGKPKTFNPLKVPTKYAGAPNRTTQRTGKGGEMKKATGYGKPVKKYKIKNNVWEYAVGYMKVTKDEFAYAHPAMFPEQLAADHIISWSNPGDIILDPFGGSGTVAKMALLNNRNFIHIDISEEYNEIANKRIAEALAKRKAPTEIIP